MGLSKNQQRIQEKLDKSKTYPLEEALELAQDLRYANFDETVELHMRLNVDPRQADQQVRGTVSLPHGTGMETRVLVFAEGEAASEAEKAGADYVGGDDLAEKIRDGWMEFDSVVATQSMMRVVGRLGPVLGPRGLMPSPKAGTVVPPEDVGEVVQQLKAGMIEYRIDKTGNLHVPVGKASFELEQLADNTALVLDTIVRNRPPAVKGQFVQNAVVTTTMGPGIKLDIAAVLASDRVL